jgi:hypothetical protein
MRLLDMYHCINILITFKSNVFISYKWVHILFLQNSGATIRLLPKTKSWISDLCSCIVNRLSLREWTQLNVPYMYVYIHYYFIISIQLLG